MRFWLFSMADGVQSFPFSGSLDPNAELGVGLGGDVARVEGKLLLVKVACGHKAAALDLVRQLKVSGEEAPFRNQKLVDAGAA